MSNLCTACSVGAPPADLTLSPREHEIVSMLARGDAGREIAAKLQLSGETVRTHIRNAMARTGTRTRSQLVAMTVLADIARCQECASPDGCLMQGRVAGD
jgi:DNA-binding CsgD family transcriptional regulator